MSPVPPPPNPAPPPTAVEQPAPHDAARTALRELVELCAQCAAREVEIDEAHRTALDQAERELTRGKSNAEMRFKSVRDEVAAKAQARIGEINAQFESESAQLEANDAGKRQVV